jgi:hypothetical protein
MSALDSFVKRHFDNLKAIPESNCSQGADQAAAELAELEADLARLQLEITRIEEILLGEHVPEKEYLMLADKVKSVIGYLGARITNITFENARLQNRWSAVDENKYQAALQRRLKEYGSKPLSPSPEEGLLTLASLKGIIATDITGGKSSEDFIREHRDNDWEDK